MSDTTPQTIDELKCIFGLCMHHNEKCLFDASRSDDEEWTEFKSQLARLIEEAKPEIMSYEFGEEFRIGIDEYEANLKELLGKEL